MAYKIIATGKVYTEPPEDAARNEVADMLRYDEGKITELKITQVFRDGKPRGWLYTAYITSFNYTKARWDSFLIRTEKI